MLKGSLVNPASIRTTPGSAPALLRPSLRLSSSQALARQRLHRPGLSGATRIHAQGWKTMPLGNSLGTQPSSPGAAFHGSNLALVWLRFPAAASGVCVGIAHFSSRVKKFPKKGKKVWSEGCREVMAPLPAPKSRGNKTGLQSGGQPGTQQRRARGQQRSRPGRERE